MSGGMAQVRERMAEYLNSRGVKARTAWPESREPLGAEPVAVVSLRGCQAESAGLLDYLGERFNGDTGLWEERYGKKLRLTLGLDLYAPEQGDGADLQRTFDRLACALTLGGPEGLSVREFSCGETVYDTGARMRKRPVQAVCDGFLCATALPGGTFSDFELRGGMK